MIIKTNNKNENFISIFQISVSTSSIVHGAEIVPLWHPNPLKWENTQVLPGGVVCWEPAGDWQETLSQGLISPGVWVCTELLLQHDC